MKHVIIAGTGRAGTSFLMQVFTKLGLKTGFRNIHDKYNKNTRSGLEIIIEEKDKGWEQQKLPYIIKSPRASFKIGTLIQSGFEIEKVIIPVRNLHDAAQSRIKKNVHWDNKEKEFNDNWEHYLGYVLGFLVTDLIMYDVPYIFLKYPDLVLDGEYLYYSLEEWLSTQGITKIHFLDVWKSLAKYEPL